MYLRLIPSANTPIPDVRAEIEIEQIMFSVLGGYEIFRNDCTTIELLGGARYMNFSLDADLVGGPPDGPSGISGDNTWWDGIIGTRIRHNFTDKIYLNAYFDIGAGDSEETWQAIGTLGYKVKENISIVGGYRYLHYDYEDGGFAYDLDTSGPVIGAVFKF